MQKGQISTEFGGLRPQFISDEPRNQADATRGIADSFIVTGIGGTLLSCLAYPIFQSGASVNCVNLESFIFTRYAL